jgi:uncharacterized protein YqgC (DUF456 family)
MEQTVKKNLKRAIGIFLIVFGVAGMILPILPGVWLIPVGLQLLGWRLVIDRKKPWREVFTFHDKTKDKDL